VTDAMASRLSGPILVFAPHPDDEVLGAGGLLAEQSKRGARVHIVHVTDGEFDGRAIERRRVQARDAAECLGVAEVEFLGFATRLLRHESELLGRLRDVVVRVRPAVLLLPHAQESDQDHAAVHLAGREAAFVATSTMVANPAPAVRLILGYEVWSPINRPPLVLPFGTKAAGCKAAAAAAYMGEIERLGIAKAAGGLATYRGCMFAGSEQAEAFTIEHCSVDLPSLILEL